MALAGVDAPAVAHPGLASLRDQAVGIVAHEEALARELFRHPQIVGIKKGDQTAARERDTAVASGSRPAPLGSYGAYIGEVRRQVVTGEVLPGAVSRTVVDDQYLEAGAALSGAFARTE